MISANGFTYRCVPLWLDGLDLVRFGSMWLDLVRCGSMWLDVALFGSMWLDGARCCSVWYVVMFTVWILKHLWDVWCPASVFIVNFFRDRTNLPMLILTRLKSEEKGMSPRKYQKVKCKAGVWMIVMFYDGGLTTWPNGFFPETFR